MLFVYLKFVCINITYFYFSINNKYNLIASFRFQSRHFTFQFDIYPHSAADNVPDYDHLGVVIAHHRHVSNLCRINKDDRTRISETLNDDLLLWEIASRHLPIEETLKTSSPVIPGRTRRSQLSLEVENITTSVPLASLQMKQQVRALCDARLSGVVIR